MVQPLSFASLKGDTRSRHLKGSRIVPVDLVLDRKAPEGDLSKICCKMVSSLLPWCLHVVGITLLDFMVLIICHILK